MLGFKRRTKSPSAVPQSLEGLNEEIQVLAARPASPPDPEAERRLQRLRHLAGIRRVQAATSASFAEPNADLPSADGALPEFTAADVTPELLRAGILRDGCVLVRGLVDRGRALAFASQIDRIFADREAAVSASRPSGGLYEEFVPEEPYAPIATRPWIQEGGGVLATDSPTLHREMLEMFGAAGLPQLVAGYLGEPPLQSADKTTLRKATPHVGGAWHQDGSFMGPVRALNLWLSLSRCGDEAPGLDIVPKRIDDIVLNRGDFPLDYVVTDDRVDQIAAEMGTTRLRPIFEPGDALFFDEMFLHQTASDPSMPKARFAIESWFFGGSAFPADYVPIAV